MRAADPAAPSLGAARVYDVRAYGAVGDGKAVDSDAINKAIDAAAAAGGGTVYVPAGSYLSFSIRLKSNIVLQLDPGATLVAATAGTGGGRYDAAEPNEWGDKYQYQDAGHSHWHNSLIWGENLENVSIIGAGVIDGKALGGAGGGGGARRGAGGPGGQGGPGPQGTGQPGAGGPGGAGGPPPDAAQQGAPAGGPPPSDQAMPPAGAQPAATGAMAQSGPGAAGAPNREGGPAVSGQGGAPRGGMGGFGNAEGQGNKALALKNCRNVTLRDFTLSRGGWFALLATGVDNFTIDNIRVDTNRDGFDIDACRNVRISNCSINAPNDDGLVLKSSFALGVARACENITITGCQLTGYEVGSLLDGTFKRTVERAPDGEGATGRIKFGTESNGGFKNITITNCVFDHCRGLALETVDGGYIENIAISNLAMRDIANAPIFMRLGNRARGPEGTKPGVIRGVSISNVVVQGADSRFGSLIAGLPGYPVEDITLSDIRIIYKNGFTLEQVAQQPSGLVSGFFTRGSGTTGPRDPFNPPEQEKAYPEPAMFGLLPSSGFYVRHARNVTIRNVEVSFQQEDKRPIVVLDDVAGVRFNAVKAPRASGVPFFVLRKVTDFAARDCPGFADTQRATADNESL